MKKDRFLLDVETTGFDEVRDQITEIAAIVEDSDCNIIDKLDMKIKLMENSVPSVGALLVTKINPFTSDWNKEAITPYEAVKKIKKFCEKHKASKGKMIFTAYNASFDKVRVAQLLKVCLEDFETLFDKSVFDPLNTARKLIEQGKLATKTKQRKNGGTYQSATLGDVSIALGTITEEKLAGLHRAMEDTELMRLTIHKLYELATGEEMVGLESIPDAYTKGDLVSAVTDLHEQGLKKHVLLIDSNDTENEKIVAIDLDHWQEVGLDEGAVKEFNYGDFLSSKKISTPKELESSQKFYDRNRSKIHMLINLLSKKEAEVVSEGANQDFELISKIEKIMSASSNEKEAQENLSKAKKEIGDVEKEKEILSLAEQFNLYKGETGWSPLLGEKLPHMEEDDAKFVEGEVKKENVKVIMNPAGFYEIHAVGKVRQATTKGDIGPTIAQMIEGAPKGGKSIKALEKDLLLIKEFTNPKHPLALKKEIEDVLSEDKDLSDEDKTIIKDLISYYKEKYPKTFSSYNPSFEKEVFNNLSLVHENLNYQPQHLEIIPHKSESLESRLNFFNQNIILDKLNILFYTVDLCTGEIFSQFLTLEDKNIDTLEIEKNGLVINDVPYILTESGSSERLLASNKYPFLVKIPGESIEVIDDQLNLADYSEETITFSPKKENSVAEENLTDIFSRTLVSGENKSKIWENIEKSIFSEENSLDFLKKRK